MIPNPKCSQGGCGAWKRPTKRNPLYKGKWRARRIKNPAYKVQLPTGSFVSPPPPPRLESKGREACQRPVVWSVQGVWRPKQLPNPEHFVDKTPFRSLKPIVAVGREGKVER